MSEELAEQWGLSFKEIETQTEWKMIMYCGR